MERTKEKISNILHKLLKRTNSAVAPKNLDVFCALPFVHINNKTNGDITTCCHISEPIRDRNGETYNITRGATFESAFRSEEMNILRKNMLDGIQDPRCNSCWKTEKLGIRSKRISDGNRFLPQALERIKSRNLPFQPLSWDIKLGANCNLKCRMCDPKTSAAIMTESIKNGWHPADSGKAYLKKNSDFFSYPQFRKELSELIEFAEEIYFLGGEPTLIRKHLELIKFAIQKNVAKQMILRWSTNLTHFDLAFIESAREFKSVIIDCSVDGYGAVNEYIRYPSLWKDFEERISLIQKELPKAHIKCVFTVQIYNIFEIENIVEWGKRNQLSVAFNYLTYPSYLSTHCLSESLKRSLIQKYSQYTDSRFKNLCDWLTVNGDPKDLEQFLSYTSKLDRVRNQNFFSIVPKEFHHFFGDLHES